MAEIKLCWHTKAVEDDEPCRGWVPEGWEWHGCQHPDRHGLAARVTHECKCGLTWKSWRGRPPTTEGES